MHSKIVTNKSFIIICLKEFKRPDLGLEKSLTIYFETNAAIKIWWQYLSNLAIALKLWNIGHFYATLHFLITFNTSWIK